MPIVTISGGSHDSAEGISEISERLSLDRKHCYLWLRRFQRDGIGGLKDRARPGRWRKPAPYIFRPWLTHEPVPTSQDVAVSQSQTPQVATTNGGQGCPPTH